MFEATQHGDGLWELAVCCLHVVVERPEVHGELALFSFVDVGVVRVASRRHGNRVIVDGVDDEPFVGGGAVGIVRGAAEPAVRHVEHGIRQCKRDALAIRFIGLCVLVGPPCGRAHALIGGDYPRPAEAVTAPGESAVPGGIPCRDGTSVVVHGNGIDVSHALGCVECGEVGRPFVPEVDWARALHHAVNNERRHEVHLELLRRRQHAVTDAIVSVDAAVAGTYGNVQVVERDVPPRARRCGVAATQAVGAGEGGAGLGAGLREREQDEGSDAEAAQGSSSSEDGCWFDRRSVGRTE